MSRPDKQQITVLLSGSGTTFAALLAHQHQHPGNFEIAHVVSDNEDARGLARARSAGIHTRVVPYKKAASRAAFNEELLSCVTSTCPDLVVLAGFMRIVDETFVDRFNARLLNIHPSLLPKYPGLNTYQRALNAGERQHGSSVHFVNNILDGGPVIAQTVVNIEDTDNAATLSARVQQAERKLYPIVIDWFCDGHLQLVDGCACLDGEILGTPRVFHFDAKNGDLRFDTLTTRSQPLA